MRRGDLAAQARVMVSLAAWSKQESYKLVDTLESLGTGWEFICRSLLRLLLLKIEALVPWYLILSTCYITHPSECLYSKLHYASGLKLKRRTIGNIYNLNSFLVSLFSDWIGGFRHPNFQNETAVPFLRLACVSGEAIIKETFSHYTITKIGWIYWYHPIHHHSQLEP